MSGIKRVSGTKEVNGIKRVSGTKEVNGIKRVSGTKEVNGIKRVSGSNKMSEPKRVIASKRMSETNTNSVGGINRMSRINRVSWIKSWYAKITSKAILLKVVIALLVVAFAIVPSSASFSSASSSASLQSIATSDPFEVDSAIQVALPIGTHAHSAAMIDVASGRMLLSHRGDERMLIASLTKVMTAIVAIESGTLTDRVKVSRRAVGKEGSSIYLRLNEEMSLEHLLYGLMLRSGNDAATAIAEHVGGSEEGFAVMMNDKARMIGMTNSHFVNPHGLDAEGHYSTANDMARLTAYALQNATFRDIVKTKVKHAPNPNDPWDYTWYNKNKMLSLYEGGDGVKTGFTKRAGRCLISSATRDGRQIAVVTLNDGNDWFDHTQWLNYGFSAFNQQVLIEQGDLISGTPYAAGSSFVYPLAEHERNQVRTSTTFVEDHSVHYQLGERGLLHFWLNDEMIGQVPIYEQGKVPSYTNLSTTLNMHGERQKQTYRSLFWQVVRAIVNG